MNKDKANHIMNLLAKTFPSLEPWLTRQYMDAVMKDMILYADEPHAMIGLAEMAASIEAFADAIAEASIEEMFHIMADMMGGV
tara:strand:- start:807 stop:1055 length:249 start_codon:yes stop_codon:yes gene_type:complete